MCVMFFFAGLLIRGLNIIVICLCIGFGIWAVVHAATLDEPRSDAEFWSSLSGGVVLLVAAACRSVWLWFVRDRIKLSADLLSAASRVLGKVPGTIGVSLLTAILVPCWWACWGYAVLEMNALIAKNHGGEEYGLVEMTAPWWACE